MIFWTHTMARRATGWLNEDFHAHFREVLLHACARQHLACPAYVLMPDHWHLVWLGMAATSDQHAATRFLRRYPQPRLGEFTLDDRAYDHVLRRTEKSREAIGSSCHYVQENPIRAGYCLDRTGWPYAGAMIAGFPELDARRPDFWEVFWRIYEKQSACAVF